MYTVYIPTNTKWHIQWFTYKTEKNTVSSYSKKIKATSKFNANWSNCLGGVRKSKFCICRDFANGKLAEWREHVDIGFNNV